jgi:triosephosphate isomerase (TIM)
MKTLIVANWKMYLNNQDSLSLVETLVQSNLEIPRNLEVVICPTHVLIGSSHNLYSRSIKLGAQDVFWESEGAYTGEVGAESLKEFGCQYVIVGHSERRAHLGETNNIVNKKLKAALKANLVPILCIGEKIEVREAGLTEEKIVKQLVEALEDVDLSVAGHLVVTYEPVWAIYPSKLKVDPIDVEKMAKLIEDKLIDLYGKEVYQAKCQIIYGGSVDSDNIEKYLSLQIISGAIVGHASTKAREFAKIIDISGGE